MVTLDGFRTSHAVVIGINAYGNGIPQLRTAVSDARRIGQVLETEFGYTVQVLIEDVSLGTLKALLDESLQKEIHADDRLLIYFAGHGIALDGDDGPAGYLVPQDARPDDRQTFLPMTDLSRWIERLPCRHLLLVLDCCFAGAFRWSSTRDFGEVPDIIHKERFDRYIRDPAWQVITSAAYDQKALDVLAGAAIGLRAPDATNGEHSPFAESFLRALQGEADLYPRAAPGRAGGDGVITATELYLYLRGCVEDGAESDSHRQTPGLWPLKKHDKGEYIYLVPGHELNLPPAPELNEASNPYRGLQSYDEEHATVFFGRSQFVKRLAERVAGQPLTIVLGASGTGKSSAVKAGLLSYLRGTESAAWQILPPIRPGKSPLASLAGLSFPGEQADDLNAHSAEFRIDHEALAICVGAWAAREPTGCLLLVVDQFEELITLCWDAGEREQFLRLLEAALASHPDRLRVVLTLRSDFEPQFAQTPLQSDWMSCRIVVPVMTLDEYREVIEGPASVKVLYFKGKNSSQEFVNRLVGDVANTPGALPLLSFTLSELFRRYLERRGEDRALWEDDYERLGGVGGSLRNRANEVYDGLPSDDHRRTMRKVMLRMISVEAGEPARRHVLDDELRYEDPDENRRVDEIVGRLTEARLVVEGTESDDQPYIEPAHDALVSGWDRLTEWTRAELGTLQLRQVLSPSVRDWSADGKSDPGKLWHDNPRLALLADELGLPFNWAEYLLRRIRALLAHGAAADRLRAAWLNRDESRFVAQSLAKKHRTTSIVAATTLAVGLALLGLTLWAWRETDIARSENARAQRGEATAKEKTQIAKEETQIAEEETQIAQEKERIANSRRLASLSASARGRRQDTALLLGVEALRSANTFEARDSLFQAFLTRPEVHALLDLREGAARSLAYSPDGKLLAAAYAGDNGGVVLWETATLRRLTADPLLVEEGNVESIAFSPDGKTLAAGCRGKRASSGDVVMERGACVVEWDLATRQRLPSTPLRVYVGAVRSVAYRPDGKTLAAGYAVPSGGGGGVIVWEVAAGQRPLKNELRLREGVVSGIAFAPDGKTLAASFSAVMRRGGGVAIWDTATRQRTTDPPIPVEEGPLTSLAFSPDGSALAAAIGGESRVIFLDTATRRRLAKNPIPVPEGNVVNLAFSTDGKTLAAGYNALPATHGGVVLWDATTGQRRVPQPFPIREGAIGGVAFGPDGKTVATGFGDGVGGVVLWGLASPPPLETYPLPVEGKPVSTVALSPDGKTVATGLSPLSVKREGVALWDLSTGRSPTQVNLPVPEGNIMCLAFSRDGKLLATGTGDVTQFGKAGIVLWDVELRQRLKADALPVPEGYVNTVAFSPDGKTLAAGISHGEPIGGVVLWDVAKRERLSNEPLPVEEGLVFSVAFSPDGKTLAATETPGNDGTGRPRNFGFVVFDVASRDRLKYFPIPTDGPVSNPVFSPDGKTLATVVAATAGRGGVVFWDTADFRRLPLDPLPVSDGAVSALAFSGDGKTLAAGLDTSRGGGVVVWDLGTRQRIAADPFPVKEGAITSLVFGTDGKSVAAGYRNRGGVVIVDLDLASWPCVAGRIANRNLTRSEWRTNFPDEPYGRTFRNLPWPSDLPVEEREQAKRRESGSAGNPEPCVP
jgi:WD40 repeat protein